ncbi:MULTISPECIES: cytochrome C biogenesis protein [unclassified Clostridium]|jgi:cutA1 divalent ion tolerance protein|uniref:cytochrome C biogenesis protein n=1 Tax=unclassified Clostridium TaxID=2614128 RepID=UPI0025BD498F|nr:cytochrome C biogenesis protein [Clostridium sp.]MCI6691050.1 cytochrome C biogenesis protein [Clostridium sp.]MDY2632167.1 cytochrome C biogenesis protein [Clostridium sp.]MDY4251288.1 cytochrome C biogenesis protein [Clostridium sp.]
MNYTKVKFEIYVPFSHVNKLREAINNTGALIIGKYDNCISITEVTGYFRPLKSSNPYLGKENELSIEKEAKMEFRCDKDLAIEVINVIKAIHPYEEPVYHIIPIIN